MGVEGRCSYGGNAAGGQRGPSTELQLGMAMGRTSAYAQEEGGEGEGGGRAARVRPLRSFTTQPTMADEGGQGGDGGSGFFLQVEGLLCGGKGPPYEL